MLVEGWSIPCRAFGVGRLSPCNRRLPAPRRACSLAALDPQFTRKLLAALWATGAAAVRRHVQGGQHGASVRDSGALEGLLQQTGSGGAVDHSVGLSH
jgi:hypothetical protein